MTATHDISELINSQGPIPFSTFMDIALYGKHGYYTRGGGFGRDFHTSPDLSPVFGTVIAHQVVQCWDLLGRPDRFDVVELGPGRGRLAKGLLDALRASEPECYAALTYTLVDRSETLLAEQRDILDGHRFEQGGIPGEIRGIVLSNEFFDAHPFEIVEHRGGQLTERWVDWDEGFYWVNVPARNEFKPVQQWLPDGGRTEISLSAMKWMQAITIALKQGWHIAIDYGRADGDTTSTATTYSGGVIGANLLANPGDQDITCQVDFETLIRIAETKLRTLGVTNQRTFLRNLGWDAYIHGLQGRVLDAAVLADNESRLRQIVSPNSLGAFTVVVQATLDLGQPLDGLVTNERGKARIANRAALRIPLADGTVLPALD